MPSPNLERAARCIKVVLDNPVGQQVATHVINELIDAVAAHVREALDPANRGSLWESETTGHVHMHNAAIASTHDERHANLVSSYGSYSSYAGGAEASFSTFYAHYWCGIACLQIGDTNRAVQHFRTAYDCGVLIVDRPGLGTVDDRYQVAVIMDLAFPNW
ncbi:hypothetical protein [Actinoallomurus iriomotensis]|uniref:Uncharacterized protein n=1 Tax=Actinoallomurus iriomotensis TaxID=478107 RepID=A0A9W6S9I2_9ACTN|nr:hypothetical protein [Actinoallomurus iriomotensis]GLY89519.1 hypothetical protein Airi02_074480 [Actinoallomurus iriomotensis]